MPNCEMLLDLANRKNCLEGIGCTSNFFLSTLKAVCISTGTWFLKSFLGALINTIKSLKHGLNHLSIVVLFSVLYVNADEKASYLITETFVHCFSPEHQDP